jgi:GNAT superfamily N-acetyltransferase
MPEPNQIKVGLLKKHELPEADRIFRLAFGTFLGLPDPLTFMEDRDLTISRGRARHVQVLAARDGGRLVGTNFLTTWGAFAFFGPLTILPEYWDKGVAQKLLKATVERFDRAGLRRTALFTFAASAKHVGLYQKFGYWPQHLTALMTHGPSPTPAPAPSPGSRTVFQSALPRSAREEAIAACRKLTNRIDKGLDLSDEIRSLLSQRIGEVILTYTRTTLDGFAIACHGAGSEGGTKSCYLKFAAARSGLGAGDRFDRLLNACDDFARSHGVSIEAGMNFAREDAYRRMRAHGYRATGQGVAMQRPNDSGFNRPDAYVIDDWR